MLNKRRWLSHSYLFFSNLVLSNVTVLYSCTYSRSISSYRPTIGDARYHTLLITVRSLSHHLTVNKGVLQISILPHIQILNDVYNLYCMKYFFHYSTLSSLSVSSVLLYGMVCIYSDLNDIYLSTISFSPSSDLRITHISRNILSIRPTVSSFTTYILLQRS